MRRNYPEEMGIVSRIRSASRSYSVIVVVALLVGALVAPVAFGAAKEIGEQEKRVAVIEVGSVIAEPTAAPVEDALEEARANESIEAVVLKVNTPGGGLAATESLALEVERTAEVMPVITSVTQMAASGGYYVSAPTDRIVASPSALVGSVGINFAYVDAGGGVGTAIQSGPDKSGGYTEEEAIEMADMMVEGFYGTVLEHRGDELELSKRDLSYAKVYPSQKALHNGLIDEIGTTDTAIQIAADRAGLDGYEVVEMDTTPDLGTIPLLSAGNTSSADAVGVEALVDPAPGVDTPVALALYGHLSEEQVIVTTAGDGTTSQSAASSQEVDA
ncbi:MAG: S49 family peptidase [Halodesulfurarchaeum sp.]|nr:S49 family peptidase [Halodesulfurarchaeum sp.]